MSQQAQQSAANAQAAQTAAEEAVTSASDDAQAAADSEDAAEASAAAALQSQNLAQGFASDAQDSATAASGSATNAASRAVAAAQSATNAAQSEANAADSAGAASSSETAAGASAEAAAISEGRAAGSAKISESWAVGGTGIRTGEDTDNAKYYAQLAQTVAQGAQGYFVTADALRAAHPTGQDGWWAIVGETDTIWIWDSDTGEWVDSSTTIDMSNYYSKQESDARYATTAQGTKADSAVQTVNGKSGTEVTLTPADVGAATSGQGALANTAVQPGDLAPYAKTENLPSTLPSPYALTINFNGAYATSYSGASARSVNITPGGIGAATAAQGAKADTAMQPDDGTHLYSATLLADNWTSAGSGQYQQTAALTPLTGGPAVTSDSVLTSAVMCEQTTVQATNEMLQEVLGIINGGNTVLGANQVVVTVFEQPEADVEAIWQIKQGVSS